MPTETDDKTETSQAAESPEAEQTTEEVAEQPDAAQTGADEPEEAVSPVEAVVGEGAEAVKATSGTIDLTTPAGSLTLRPNQTELDNEQRWALAAIGIDTQNDPGVVPHLRAFIHMCQVRGLDPFAREAYLIGRGKNTNRKWTMQTGIDGYRKMANSTQRLIRVADVLWTGADDDDRSYRPDANGVMRRVWYDQWPASRGNPGAAKAVVEHYDLSGNRVFTEAVADWGMYAPYNDVWEGSGEHRRPKRDPDTGETVQELTAMWRKGGPFMLGKCAEALAYRKAFPATLNGIYVTEEMHRLDAAENQRVKAEQVETRREAYAAATQAPTGPLPTDDSDDGVEAPTHVSEAVSEVVNGIVVGDPADLLRSELDHQAHVLGQAPERVAQRQVRALRKNLDDFTADELLPLVTGLRLAVAEAMERTGDSRAGDYKAACDDREGPIVLPWDAVADDTADDPADPADDEALDADPEQPHKYVDDGEGACRNCGSPSKFGDDPLHPAELQ